MGMTDALAPGIIVAAPTMQDPRFARSVILLAHADAEGALGFVVNRRAPFTFNDLADTDRSRRSEWSADEIGVEMNDKVRDAAVHYGGPVSPERGWVLYRSGSKPADDDVLEVGPHLQVATTLDVLTTFLAKQSADPFRLLLGYAGWEPNQLESELAEGAWLPLDLDSDLVFDEDVDGMWETAVRSMGLLPGGFMMGGGGAEA